MLKENKKLNVAQELGKRTISEGADSVPKREKSNPQEISQAVHNISLSSARPLHPSGRQRQSNAWQRRMNQDDLQPKAGIDESVETTHDRLHDLMATTPVKEKDQDTSEFAHKVGDEVFHKAILFLEDISSELIKCVKEFGGIIDMQKSEVNELKRKLWKSSVSVKIKVNRKHDAGYTTRRSTELSFV